MKRLNTSFFGSRADLKLIVLLPFLCLMLHCAAFGQAATTFWYIYGEPVTVYYQPDVYAFTCYDGLAYTGAFDTAVVASLRHRADREDKSIEVRFKTSSTLDQRLAEISRFRLSPTFGHDYPVITHDATLDHTREHWTITDNLLLVNFKDPYISQDTVIAFMSRHNLAPYSFPDVSSPPGNPTYIFRIQHDYSGATVCHQKGNGLPSTLSIPISEVEAHLAHGDFVGACNYDDDPYVVNGIKTAREVVEEEPELVLEANPNFANIRTGVDAAPTYGVTIADPGAGGCLTDPDLWNLYNDGTFNNPFSGGGATGNAGADANICDCRTQGLWGNDVYMAVVATGEYYLNHPGMTRFYYGIDCSGGYPCAALSSSNSGNVSLGMEISGIAAGDFTGAAPHAKITPAKVLNSTVSYAWAFQHLRFRNYLGAIGTDYFSFLPNSSLEGEMNWHVLYGRSVSGSIKGTVVISPVGGAFDVPSSTDTVYPGVLNNIVGVICSTPDDSLDFIGDGWGDVFWGNPDYAANYGNIYDFAAPGNYIKSPTANVGNTYFQDMNGSMGAVGTTMGVVGLLIEADTNGLATDLVQLLQTGASQVSYAYSGGLSLEFSHGRLNCGASLVGMDEGIATASQQVSVTNPVDEIIEVFYDFKTEKSDASYTLRDAMGRFISEGIIGRGQGQATINVQSLAQGMYLLTITDEQQKPFKSWKIIKL